MRRYLTVSVTAVTLGCASQPAPDRNSLEASRVAFLTHEELKTLFANRLTVRFAWSGQSGIAILEKDGTARVDGGNWQLIGSWRIEGNRYCSTYTQIGSNCYNVHKTGRTSYTLFPTDGSPTGTWEIQQ